MEMFKTIDIRGLSFFSAMQLASKEFVHIKKNGILEPVRFRAILKTENPRHVIKSLDSIDVRAIVPTEDWELLGPQTSFPNGLKLSRETVSLPIYPSLTNEDLDHVLSGIAKK